jgi:biotin carboxylase
MPGHFLVQFLYNPRMSSHAKSPLTILCLASYEKGHEFLREAKRLGCRVLLLTSESLKDTAKFPVDSIDDIFYMPDVDKKWDRQDTIDSISYLARHVKIDCIVPLDDFDLETAAALREHLRVPGMGETTTRYFRDKLAMRIRAQSAGIHVPEFTGVVHHPDVDHFTRHVPAPWVLKPRFQAGAVGIKKVGTAEELWDVVNAIGNEQSNYLIERYVPGDIYHVDSIIFNGKVLFSIASRYGTPPFYVAHGGGIFTTATIPQTSQIAKSLITANRTVMKAMGMVRGVSHTEFIRTKNGKIYFLETSARVGGAHIVELIEAATGLNMWAEWAKIEFAGEQGNYKVPKPRNDHAGLLVSLARQEWPDMGVFSDPEVCWRIEKKNHVGLIVKSRDSKRIQQLLDTYTELVQRDFHAAMDAQERPTA